LLSGASFTDSKVSGTFFEKVDFRGAVGPSGSAEADWWKGWTKLDLSL